MDGAGPPLSHLTRAGLNSPRRMDRRCEQTDASGAAKRLLSNMVQASHQAKPASSPVAAAASANKGPWTKDEDEMLIELVNEHGTKQWSIVASHLKARTGKQCRERWINNLDPTIKKVRAGPRICGSGRNGALNPCWLALRRVRGPRRRTEF